MINYEHVQHIIADVDPLQRLLCDEEKREASLSFDTLVDDIIATHKDDLYVSKDGCVWYAEDIVATDNSSSLEVVATLFNAHKCIEISEVIDTNTKLIARYRMAPGDREVRRQDEVEVITGNNTLASDPSVDTEVNLALEAAMGFNDLPVDTAEVERLRVLILQ